MRRCILTFVSSTGLVPYLCRSFDQQKRLSAFARWSLRDFGSSRIQSGNAQYWFDGRFEHGRASRYWRSSIFSPSMSHAGGNVTAARQRHDGLLRGRPTEGHQLSDALVRDDWCKCGIECAGQCRKAARRWQRRCVGRAWEVLDFVMLFLGVETPTVAYFVCSLPRRLQFFSRTSVPLYIFRSGYQCRSSP
jgi:hypothetical protein